MVICLLTLISMVVILNCDRPSNNIKIEKSKIQYLIPESSRGKIVGNRMRYELWYDMNKWMVYNRESDEFKKFTEGIIKNPDIYFSYIISNRSYEVTVMIDEAVVPVVYQQQYNDKLKRTQKAGQDLISADIRSVNGNDALCMWSGDKEMRAIEYIMSNKTGTVRVGATTSKNKFSEYESDMIDLLNGIVDRSDISDEDFEQQKLSPTADTYVNKGITHFDKGQYDQAISEFSKAIKISPEYAKPYKLRGIIYYVKKQFDKALYDFTSVIEIDPNKTETYSLRAQVYHAGTAQYDMAISDYSMSIAINPEDAKDHNNLAWLYATAKDASYRNGSKAIEYANKAVSIEKSSTTLDTLAAAYAESRDFANAVKTINEALELCTDPEYEMEIKKVKEAYQAEKTYAQYKYGE